MIDERRKNDEEANSIFTPPGCDACGVDRRSNLYNDFKEIGGMAKEKQYRITMTESQLRLMADAVEDWHRFLAGQCEMANATSFIEDMHEARKNLNDFVRPYIVPELKHNGASYGWSGGNCPNKYQRKAIAMSYMIYRETIHYLTTHNGKDMSWNCYNSETLTCEDQGPLIKIEEV